MAEIGQEMLIPEVVSRYPSARGVLDKYGLRGCGGPLGPRESLEFFSRAHGVDLATLLQELRDAATGDERAGRVGQPSAYKPTAADVVYRRFFPAALLVLFTVGGLLGGLLLAGLVWGWFPGLFSPALVQAHANAMVYGFLGVMAMGFAYQAFPRYKRTSLWRADLAYASLFLMLGGVGLRFAAALFPGWGGYAFLGTLSGLLQLAAASLLAAILVTTFHRGQRRDPWDKFVYAALFWLLLSALVNTLSFAYPGLGASLYSLQLLGFLATLTLGVSQHFLPGVLGFPQRQRDLSWPLFWGINLSLVGHLVFTRWEIPAGLTLSHLLLVATAGAAFFYLGIPAPTAQPDRSVKFARAAYSWLAVAALLLLLTPYFSFSPDAWQHALALGFLTMMVVAVSSKVVPTLAGTSPSRLGTLLPAWVLLNLGVVMRGPLRAVADGVGGWGWMAVGLSSLPLAAGLLLWGWDIFRILSARAAPAPAAQPITGLAVSPQMKVGEVLERYPQTLEVFLRYGFTNLQDPVNRQTMGQIVTLEGACSLRHLDPEEFLRALDQAIDGKRRHNGK